jgi:hypothetical protein
MLGNFPIENGIKQGEASSQLLLKFSLDMQLGESRIPGETGIKRGI